MTRKMPAQKPGKSKQDYETPDDFMYAVAERFGSVLVDLACTGANCKAMQNYITPEEDSLSCDWRRIIPQKTVAWLNPPYSNIALWAKKCCETAPTLALGSAILLLVPASVGSLWFARYVVNKAYVYFLHPRIQFIGTSGPYPKDLMLCRYNQYSHYELETEGWFMAEIWNWK